MTLKKCPSCKTAHTTRSVFFIGRTEEPRWKILWFNCPACRSTFVLRHRKEEP